MQLSTNGYRFDLVESLGLRRAALHDHHAWGAVMDHAETDLCVYTLDDLRTIEQAEELANTEDQKQVNSCGGHGGTTAFERAYEIDQGVRVQFSRMYLYLRGKAQDGIRGDNGMTISGGVKQLRERGCCLESTFPYPGRYVQSIPTGADAEAAKYKLGAAVDVTASGDVNEFAQRFLGHNMGALYNGCSWTDAFSNPVNGVIERWATPTSRDGGHAWALVGLSPRQDSRGYHYYWLANSWGVSWGRRGFAELAPEAFAGMCAHRWTEAMALSNPIVPTARKRVTWNLSS